MHGDDARAGWRRGRAPRAPHPCERVEVARVDADDAGARLERGLELGLVDDLDERLDPLARGPPAASSTSRARLTMRAMRSTASAPRVPRLVDLPLVDHELLGQERDGAPGAVEVRAARGEVAPGAVEELRVAEDADHRGARLGVGQRARCGRERAREGPGAGAAELHLGDEAQRRARRAAQRADDVDAARASTAPAGCARSAATSARLVARMSPSRLTASLAGAPGSRARGPRPSSARASPWPRRSRWRARARSAHARRPSPVATASAAAALRTTASRAGCGLAGEDREDRARVGRRVAPGDRRARDPRDRRSPRGSRRSRARRRRRELAHARRGARAHLVEAVLAAHDPRALAPEPAEGAARGRREGASS